MTPPLDASFGFTFPAIRGVQARREYYVTMCPLRLIPRIFVFNEEEMPPEMRAQRVLNKNRLPEMSRYVLDNPNDYVFSAITASIDGEVLFESLGEGSEGDKVGLLRVPMDAKFIINDGQHRRAAIEMALRDHPDLGHETISVVFFMDLGLKRCQQMFADLNRYAIRPSKSIGVLYDHRDDKAHLARLMVLKSAFFRDIVELERNTLSLRSRKLFTLSAIYNATAELLEKLETESREQAASIATEYWETVGSNLKEWGLVRSRTLMAGEVREEYIHSHGIVLHCLGIVGNFLLREHSKTWKRKIKGIATINWSRSNATLWEGRAMIGGRVSKSSHNITLTTTAIKQHLKLALSPEEQRAEDAFNRQGTRR